MNMRTWLAIILCLLATCAMAQPVGWVYSGGLGIDIGAGGGQVWLIGKDTTIWRWHNNTWVMVPGLSGGARIDVDSRGNPLVVTKDEKLFRWNGSAWYGVDGLISDIGASATGEALWAIGGGSEGGANRAIFRWEGNAGWVKKAGGAVRIDVDAQGVAWVVNASNEIYRWSIATNRFDLVQGGAKDIGVSGDGNSVWIVGTDGSVWSWNGAGWLKRDGVLANITVDERGFPWGVNAGGQPHYAQASQRVPNLVPVGNPTVLKQPGITYGMKDTYPGNLGCPTHTYTVPADVSYLQITAIGGAGIGGDSANLIATIAAMAGANAPGSVTNWATISGGQGGRGARVTAVFKVTPGQVLYVTPGLNGHESRKAWRGTSTQGFPGGGAGYHIAGGYSMVSTQPPRRPLNHDPNYCYTEPQNLLMVAGGGGGGGSAATSGSGGTGGDAGMIGQPAPSGGSGGGGWSSGGGGGGGAQSAGGAVGSHPGCGSEARWGGSYLRGGDQDSYGGPGGGGYYGGGAGGDGDCFLNTGHGGGGGGSSYVSATAINASSIIDASYSPGVILQPMKGS